MKIKIAVLTDTHTWDECCEGDRRGDLAELLLTRAVYRLNRWVKPDVVVFLGDLVEDDASASLHERLESIAGIAAHDPNSPKI